MKGIKCIGFLILSVLVAPFLLTSSDAKALKYDINSIPLVTPVHTMNNINTNGPMWVMYDPFGVDSSDNYQLKNLWYFNMTYNSTTQKCDYKSYDHANQYTNMSYYLIPYYIKPVEDYYASNVVDLGKCNTRDAITNINRDSFPAYAFGTPDLRSFLPYRYEYSGIYLNDNYKKDGYDRYSKFEFSEIFEGGIPDSFNKLQIPIGNVTKNLSNRHIEYRGSMYFDSESPTTSVLTLGQNAQLQVKYETYASAQDFKDQNGVLQTVNCSSLNVRQNDNPNEAPYILDYSCPIDMPDDSRFTGFTLMFTGNPLWTYTDTWRIYWDTSVVITDYDETPAPAGDEWTTFHVNGNFDSLAPGSASAEKYDVKQDGVNWTSSLATLFSFNLLNPFAPIFNLFSDQNACAQIPTIAGMIHSQETEVCPWFSPTVRNIVTPVLGLASVMLIFGFTVRWLGARSGNLFEDSMETDNYSFSNKFGRKK